MGKIELLPFEPQKSERKKATETLITQYARHSPIEIFHLFISEELLELILKHINEYVREKSSHMFTHYMGMADLKKIHWDT